MSQTAAFRQLVRGAMRRSPVLVPVGTTCAQVVRRMTEAAVDSILVTGADATICGIVTEQDVVRRIAFHVSGDVPVDRVMTSPVHSICDTDYLYHAIATMRRLRLRHMPVVDQTGQAVGLLHLHEALARVSAPLVTLIDRLTHADTVEGLGHVKAAQVEVANALFADNVPAADIQTLLSDINRDLYRRVITLALRGMAACGWEAPPVAFTAIVMGSCGRGESHLGSDQDNGFILADYPDEEHIRIDPYFIELATRMTRLLHTVGVPLCSGNVMATSPLWRKTLSQWCEQTSQWMQRRSHVSLRHADIFFDFVPVYGAPGLAQRLRQHVSTLLQNHPAFLRDMYRLDAEHHVALSAFGRLVSEPQGKRRGRRINLKYRGILPLIEGVRVLALLEGMYETSTLQRMRALHGKAVLDANQYDYLSGAFELISSLLLRQQITDFMAGREISNEVPMAVLSKRQKDMLVDCFRAISTLRQRVEFALTGNLW